MLATSSAGRTARWRCAGALRGWWRPASSSAVSTATCTCRPFRRRWRPRSPGPSPARARIRRRWKRPDDHRGRHRSSTELGTSSEELRCAGSRCRLFPAHRELSCTLDHPPPVRMVGDAGESSPPGMELDAEQDVEGLEAYRLYGEEVGGHDG